MKIRTLITALVLGFSPMLASADAAGGSESPELVEKMHWLQYFAHKIQLSIDAGNKKLAGFYAHELEEIIEQLEQVKTYDGHPIGELSKSILLPAFKDLEQAIKDGPWQQAAAKFDKVVQACNRCHQNTEHGFIVIKRIQHNPFMQSFEPAKQ